MKRWIALCLPLCGLLFGGNTWRDDHDLARIMEILIKDGARQAMSYAESHAVKPYDVGVYFLKRGNIEHAKKWYYECGRATGEHQYLYGYAYVEWKAGDHIGALKDAEFLLEKDPPPKILARTHYLQGHIKLHARDLEQAELHFRTSLEAYESMEPPLDGGRYLNYTMLATHAIYTRDFEGVDGLLEKALSANAAIAEKGKRPYSEGPYFEILAEKHFYQGDYVNALAMTQKSHQAFASAGEQVMLDMVLVKLGLLSLLTGDVARAHDIASSVWEDVKHDPSQALRREYNNVTLAKISKCSGHMEDYEGRKRSIQSWAGVSPGGQFLLDLLDMVDHAPCPALKE